MDIDPAFLKVNLKNNSSIFINLKALCHQNIPTRWGERATLVTYSSEDEYIILTKKE